MAKKAPVKKVDKYTDIKTLFIKSDLSKAEINKYIKEKEKEIKEAYPEWSEEQTLEHLFNSIYSERKRVITDIGGEDFVLEIHHFTTPFDWTEGRRRIALDEYKKDPKKAVKDGYVRLTYDKAGRKQVEPLYYWDTNKAGQENKMKGQPLPEKSYLRTIGGVGKRISKKGSEFMRFEMDISGVYSDPTSKEFRRVLTNQMLNVNCDFVEIKDDIMQLKARSTTFFNDLNEEYEIDPDDIEKYYEDSYVPLTNIEKWFKELPDASKWISEKKTSRGTHQMVVSKCLVISIEPPLQNRSAILYVDDRKRGLYDKDGNEIQSFKSWWNEDIPLDFGNNSMIYLFYEVNQQQVREGNEFTGEWQQIAFSAMGCVVIHRTKKEYKEVSSDAVITEDEFIPELEGLDEISEEEEKELEIIMGEVNDDNEDIEELDF